MTAECNDYITGQIELLSDINRMVIGDCRLHCGDVIEVLEEGGWTAHRVEMGPGSAWYLVGTKLNPVGLIARICRK